MLAPIEGQHSQVIKEILSSKSHDSKTHDRLADFVALTFYRTPFQKVSINDLLVASVETTFRMIEEKGMLPSPPESMRPHMINGKMPLPNVEIKNWKLLEMMFQVYSESPVLQIIKGMKSVVLFSESTNQKSLITSDNPVILYDQDYDLKSPYGSGFATPTVEVSIPLSANALAIFRHDELFPNLLDDHLITSYNNRMVVSSTRFIYTGESTEELFESVKSLHSQSLYSPVAKLESDKCNYIKTKQIPVCRSHFNGIPH